MTKASPPPGTADIFPEEAKLWTRLEDAAKKIFPLYGYGELRTPIFEYTEVFTRGIGNQTEVVQKEMYTFEDRGGRSLTLRPEGTAGVMRALLNTDVMNGNEKRVFYIGPMFRGERPAAGRRRQFHQVGVENVGRAAPELDAECIAMLVHYLDVLGISGAEIRINTRGTREDRGPAAETLKNYFQPVIDKMCGDCRERLEKNVWRILDCKCPECQDYIASAPETVSLLSDATRAYFKQVCAMLDEIGIVYEVDPRLVRGLDYYVHTVFEVVHPGLGAQNAVAGGGRYELFLPDNKKPVIGVGFAAGLERLMMVQEALQVPPPGADKRPVFLASIGPRAKAFIFKLAGRLRKAGIPAIAEAEDKSVKAQMRGANRINACWVVICGDSELEKGIVVCKNMDDGEQLELVPEALVEFFIRKTT